MRRAPIGRESPPAEQDADDGSLPRGDWTARHARTRAASDGSNVRAEDPDDDWPRRHGRTRRT